MTVYAYPSGIPPSKVVWELAYLSQVFQSPLNNSVQTLERPGAGWKARLDYLMLEEAEARQLIAFLAKLRGRSGRFTLWDHSMENPRGIASGTPLVNGADQTGTSLITDGWSNSITGLLLEGDYFGFDNELKMITQDINSDGSGDATLTFVPPIRTAPSDNATITVVKPTARMMLSKDNNPKWSMDDEGTYRLSFECEEGFTI